jgi:UDP-N-acetyl-D-mannosaminuronate dehydrogenase
VPAVTVGGAKLESIDWGQADLAGLDVVVITTAHDTYDWAAIVRDAPLVIDTRNATGPLPAAPNLVRL